MKVLGRCENFTVNETEKRIENSGVTNRVPTVLVVVRIQRDNVFVINIISLLRINERFAEVGSTLVQKASAKLKGFRRLRPSTNSLISLLCLSFRQSRLYMVTILRSRSSRYCWCDYQNTIELEQDVLLERKLQV